MFMAREINGVYHQSEFDDLDDRFDTTVEDAKAYASEDGSLQRQLGVEGVEHAVSTEMKVRWDDRYDHLNRQVPSEVGDGFVVRRGSRGEVPRGSRCLSLAEEKVILDRVRKFCLHVREVVPSLPFQEAFVVPALRAGDRMLKGVDEGAIEKKIFAVVRDMGCRLWGVCGVHDSNLPELERMEGRLVFPDGQTLEDFGLANVARHQLNDTLVPLSNYPGLRDALYGGEDSAYFLEEGVVDDLRDPETRAALMFYNKHLGPVIVNPARAKSGMYLGDGVGGGVSVNPRGFSITKIPRKQEAKFESGGSNQTVSIADVLVLKRKY
jgi:hypothetical protein